MIRHIFVISLILATTSIFAQKAKQECYQYIQKYAPGSFGILKLIDATPSKFNINGVQINLGGRFSPETYFRGSSQEQKIKSLNTVIHESHHHFNSVYAYELLSKSTPEDYQFGNTYSAFYYSDDDIVLVKHTEVFNSNELKREIPKALQSFRYRPYITPKTNLGSQVQGIYGLMDEFHSYYLGSKASLETYSHYKTLSESNMNVFLDFISNASSSSWAFYEFKYFCLKYLEKAQKDYPQIYQQLISNRDLRHIYTKTALDYEVLVDEFHQRQKEIMALAQAQGLESRIEDGFFWIGGRGVGNIGEKTDELIEELKKPEMIRLHNLFLLN